MASERESDGDNVNVNEFVAFPKHVITGVLREGIATHDVAEALAAAGVSRERIRFLEGEEGLRILDPKGRGIAHKVVRTVEHMGNEGPILDRVAQRLAEGRAIVGIFDTHEDDADLLHGLLEGVGVEELHYFGRRTID